MRGLLVAFALAVPACQAAVVRPAPASLRLVFELRGVDGNDARPATFRRVLEVGPDRFSLAKLVRYDVDATFFERHVYRFTRAVAGSGRGRG